MKWTNWNHIYYKNFEFKEVVDKFERDNIKNLSLEILSGSSFWDNLYIKIFSKSVKAIL